jgi:hypothetical protein
LNRFINILKVLADVFQITPKAIRVFYDDNINSIAFNREGELFFNLKFYIGLHDEKCKTKPTMDAMTYWFMTLCHELAHNFIESHDSKHEVSIKQKKKNFFFKLIFFIFIYIYIIY